MQIELVSFILVILFKFLFFKAYLLKKRTLKNRIYRGSESLVLICFVNQKIVNIVN